VLSVECFADARHIARLELGIVQEVVQFGLQEHQMVRLLRAICELTEKFQDFLAAALFILYVEPDEGGLNEWDDILQ